VQKDKGSKLQRFFGKSSKWQRFRVFVLLLPLLFDIAIVIDYICTKYFKNEESS